MGDSSKWVKSKKRRREKERKKERLNDGDNNGQATHGARKHAWRTQAAWANKSVLVINLVQNAGLSLQPAFSSRQEETQLMEIYWMQTSNKSL